MTNFVCSSLEWHRETRRLFHQLYTYEFFVWTLIWQLFSSYVSSCVFALAKNSYKKCTRIMLMKLTPGRIYYNEIFIQNWTTRQQIKRKKASQPFVKIWKWHSTNKLTWRCSGILSAINFQRKNVNGKNEKNH